MVVTNPQHENRSNRITTSYPGESIRPTRNGRGIFKQGKSKAQEEFEKRSHERTKSIFYGM